MGIKKKDGNFKGIVTETYSRLSGMRLDVDSLTGELQLATYFNEEARINGPRENAVFENTHVTFTEEQIHAILDIVYPLVEIEGGVKC